MIICAIKGVLLARIHTYRSMPRVTSTIDQSESPSV